MNSENPPDLREPASEDDYTIRPRSTCQEIGACELQEDTFSGQLKPTFLSIGQSEIRRHQEKMEVEMKQGER